MVNAGSRLLASRDEMHGRNRIQKTSVCTELFWQHFGDGFPDSPAGSEEECGGGYAECDVPKFSGAKSFVSDVSAEVDGGIAKHWQHDSLRESGDTDESDRFGDDKEGGHANERKSGRDPAHKFDTSCAFVVT